jgi:type II secretory pathway pseudopilin PulG
MAALAAPVLMPGQGSVLPAQATDAALRSRVRQFYAYRLAAATNPAAIRNAEQLIAQESRSDFHKLSDPPFRDYSIRNIEYSESFTKAKVVITARLPVHPSKPNDLPTMVNGTRGQSLLFLTVLVEGRFASYWKTENGLWCWYYNKEAVRHAPDHLRFHNR